MIPNLQFNKAKHSKGHLILFFIVFCFLSKTSLQAQNLYPNLDFSQGNFVNWSATSGPQTGSGGTRNFTGTAVATPSALFSIITPGTQPKDPNACYNISKVPAGKNYSIRVGPLSPGGYGNPLGYRLSYTLTVSAARPIIIYQFAFIQEFDHGSAGGDPYGFGGGTGGSGPGNNAQMAVSTLDAGGNPVGGVCGNYRLYPGVATNVSWFKWSHCGDVSNTPWITDVIDLTAYIGQTLTLQFTTMDCYTGHHMAYSYISPASATRDTVTYYCPGGSAKMVAPAGFKTYSWQEVSGSFNQVKQNAAIIGQDIADVNALTVNNPIAGTQYECTFTSYNGCSGKITYELKPDSIHSKFASVLATTACQKQDFTDLSSVSLPARSSVSQWKWSFDDPASGASNVSSLQNPAHRFSNTGTYLVKLVVTSSTGCKDSITTPVSIIKQENADFNFTAGTCQKDAVLFTDASTGAIASRQWDFGDASPSSSDIAPSHAYSSAGNFTVNLKITSPLGCESNQVKQVTIHPKPVAQFSIPASVCLVDKLVPIDQSTIPSPGSIQSWTWDFGDGSAVSTTKQASHLYNTTGNYSVSLAITSSNGCKDTVQKPVKAATIPTVSFTLDKNSGCIPLCFTANSSTSIGEGFIQSFQWKADNVIIGTVEQLSWCANNSGTKNISLFITSDLGCTASFSRTINAHPKPRAEFTPLPAIATLENPTISFNIESTDASHYQWNFGDNHSLAETGTTVSHTYAYSGTYKVTLTASNSYGCEETEYRTVLIDSIYTVRIPNAFSPNGDGIHDLFEVGNIRFFPEAVLEVFNQWGEMVFKSDPGYGNPWDGTRNGKVLPVSSYYYVLHLNKGNQKSESGYITIVR